MLSLSLLVVLLVVVAVVSVLRSLHENRASLHVAVGQDGRAKHFSFGNERGTVRRQARSREARGVCFETVSRFPVEIHRERSSIGSSKHSSFSWIRTISNERLILTRNPCSFEFVPLRHVSSDDRARSTWSISRFEERSSHVSSFMLAFYPFSIRLFRKEEAGSRWRYIRATVFPLSTTGHSVK